MEEEKGKKSYLRRAFDSVKSGARNIGRRTVDEATELKDDVTEEVQELRDEGAEFLENHGKSRIKTGAATAFKAEVFKVWGGGALKAGASKIGSAGAFALKTGAVTGPLAKFTVPIAFTIGFLGGPYISRKAAELLRRKPASNDNDESGIDRSPDLKADNVNGPVPEDPETGTDRDFPPSPPPPPMKP